MLIQFQINKDICDNSSVLFYPKNNKRSDGSKHIEITYLVVKHKIEQGQSTIEHIGTEVTVADTLTKGLAPKLLKEHVVSMGVLSCLMFLISWNNCFSGSYFDP